MRLIDADALALFLVTEGQEHPKKYGFKLGDTIRFSPSQIDEIARKMPTIEEPKTGRWRPIQIGKWHGFECTSCKISREVPCSNNGRPQWKYCPECGSYNGGEG